MAKKSDFFSSDEEEEVETTRNKKGKIESDVEEGELSSDDDIGNIEKLFKSNDDRKRLHSMTEKEREEEIFKRTLELNELKNRQKYAKKLEEKKREQSNRNLNKRSIDDIFNSEDESDLSSVSHESVPKKKRSKYSPLVDRQKTLDSQKQSKKDTLSQLNKKMKQRKEKNELINKEEALKKEGNDSNSSDLEDKKISNVDRQTNLSSSESEQGDEPEDLSEDKSVETLDQLNKIRLSRHKLEKWVHMPFFKELVKGCFVRVNIGEGPKVEPIYRIAEIIEVVETVKIYDLGKTRTNAGLKLRIGKSATMFRLLFVSNQSFLQTEFDSWRRRIVSEGFSLPKLSFIERKAQKLQEYSNYTINDEEIMKQVLQSKQRFQKGPVNYAMRKAELTRLKLAAEDDGDVAKANQYQDEIDELNMKMEKLERKRTEGIKSISYINQRNRENTERDIEKALELERAENLEWEKKGGDPFVREATKPVLNHRKKKSAVVLEPKKDVRKEQKNSEENDKEKEREEEEEKEKERAAIEAKININNIHNFELNLDIKVDHEPKINNVVPKAEEFDVTGSIMNAINNSLGNITSTSLGAPTSSRRTLNLSDYKRRKGLI